MTPIFIFTVTVLFALKLNWHKKIHKLSDFKVKCLKIIILWKASGRERKYFEVPDEMTLIIIFGSIHK